MQIKIIVGEGTVVLKLRQKIRPENSDEKQLKGQMTQR